MEKCHSSWAFATHVADPEETRCTWLQIDPATPAVVILIVNQIMEELSISSHLFSSFLISSLSLSLSLPFKQYVFEKLHVYILLF